jgi:hypothetical protein
MPMTRTRSWVMAGSVIAAIVVIIFVVSRQLGDPMGSGVEPRVTAAAPAGQPAVALVSVDGFRQTFNDADSLTRLIVMLSPT